MEIYGRIKNEMDWFNIAPPEKGAEHWKDGRSAKELAKYFTAEGGTRIPTAIKELLETYGVKDEQFICYPEHETKFDDFKGNGRKHDLLMVHKDIIIGIEAKAGEELGRTIQNEIERANNAAQLRSSGKTNLPDRIKGLAKSIFDDDNLLQIHNLRYQLLHATAGTLCEARERGVSRAVLLILNFKPYVKTNVRKVYFKENEMAIENYIKMLDKLYKAKQPYKIAYPNKECYPSKKTYPEIEFSIEEITIQIPHSVVLSWTPCK